MGFNNRGVDALVDNVKRASYKGILGINIGKNFDTPIEQAADDYLICLRKVYALRQLRRRQHLLAQHQEPAPAAGGRRTGQPACGAEGGTGDNSPQQHGKYVPLALKIAPDLDTEQIIAIADAAAASTASTA